MSSKAPTQDMQNKLSPDPASARPEMGQPPAPVAEADHNLPDPAAVFDLDRSISHLLHRAQQRSAALHAAQFGDEQLTQRQLTVLAALAQNDGVSQTDLVATTGIDRSTLAEMVVRMVARGLAERVKAPHDSRANVVSVTPLGRATYDAAVPHLIAHDAKLLSWLPAKSREACLAALVRLAQGEDATALSDLPGDARKKKKKKDRKKKKSK